MNRRLVALMRKEFIQFFRDKALVILVLYTFLEIALCGWALTLEVHDMPTAVYDGDRTVESRAVIETFGALDSFKVVEQVDQPSTIDNQMDQGDIRFGLIIAAGFGEALATDTPAELQLAFDGSNSSLAGQAAAEATNLLRDYNEQIILARVERDGLSRYADLLPQVRNQFQVLYMPELKYVHFVMLTMLTISVLLLGVLLPAAGIVREKEAGTFEQIMVTPVSSSELIISKIVPMMALKLVGLTVGVVMSMWLFDVPLRGNLVLFYGISVLMFFSSSGIGVLMGAIARNMQQTLLLAFLLLFPLAFLSGTMVPIGNMPTLLQWLTYLSPLRYYVTATLGIFLKGVGLDILWPQALALTISGLVLLSISTLRLRRNLADV
jgi:ABC-2 type transport system permease protein